MLPVLLSVKLLSRSEGNIKRGVKEAFDVCFCTPAFLSKKFTINTKKIEVNDDNSIVFVIINYTKKITYFLLMRNS